MAITINGSGTIAGISAGGLPLGAGGKIAQVLSITKTDTASTTSTTAVDVSGMSITITPTSSSTKMLLLATIGLAGTTSDDYAIHFDFGLGGSTLTAAQGDAAGNRDRVASAFRIEHNYLPIGSCLSFLHDHNSSSNLTYSLQFSMDSNCPGSAVINRTGSDADLATRSRGISTLIVMEVAA